MADKAKSLFLEMRGTTEEKMLILKRQLGGVDKFLVKVYLQNELRKWETHD